MSLSLEEVRHVALLARLGLTDDEVESIRDDMASILSHIEVLGRLDTEAISPTAQVIAVDNVMRDDSIAPSLDQQAVMNMAPSHENGFILVPRVLGGEDIEGGA